jgi:hypothetical protein
VPVEMVRDNQVNYRKQQTSEKPERVPHIIRTSDRGQFKGCRRAWDWGSKIRQNWDFRKAPSYLEFGTAIHRGLEVYYNPDTWTLPREVVMPLAVTEYVNSYRQARKDYLDFIGRETLDDLQQEEWEAQLELGKKMLANYFAWAKNNDRFTPRFVEVEFEVPIPVPPGLQLPADFENRDGYLWFRGEQVVYQGRIDLLLEDEYGRYWVDDHKTTAQMREDTLTFLELDEQTGSYCWAIQEMLGIPVAGALYNELYKGVPEPPPENKVVRMGRKFSVSKSQDTSYEVYKETVKEGDPVAYEAGLYDDILNYLRAEGNKYFRRTQIHRSPTELKNLGYTICLEAIDMLNDPLIYPNPTKFRCGFCAFRAPCLMQNDGSDYEWLLKENYVQR